MQSKREHRRGKLLEKLDDQLSMVQALISGEVFSRNRRIWQTNEDGQRVLVDRPKRMRAANHLYALAPRDGTAIGIVTLSLWLEEVLGNPAVKYKTDQFNWIGRVADVLGVIMTWNTSSVKTAADLRSREIPIATTGPGSTTYGYSLMLNEFAKTRFKIVSGYQGSAPSLLAMERGEVEAATTDWNLLRTGKSDWLRDKTVNVLLLHSGKRLKDLPDVPAAGEIAETSEGQQILDLYASGQDIVGR